LKIFIIINGFLFPPQKSENYSNSIKKAIYLGAVNLEKMKNKFSIPFPKTFLAQK